jgi:hypothetical protein
MTEERRMITRLQFEEDVYNGYIDFDDLPLAPQHTDEQWRAIKSHNADLFWQNENMKARIKELEKDRDVLNMWFGDAVDGETKFKEKADAWDKYCELMNELQDYVGCVRTPGDVMIAEQKRRQTVAELQARIKELETELGKKFKPNAYDNDGNPIQYGVE